MQDNALKTAESTPVEKVVPRIEKITCISGDEYYYLYTENFSVNITELSKVVAQMHGYTSMSNLLRRLQAAALKPALDTDRMDVKTLGEAATSLNYLTEFADCFSILE